MKNKKSFINSLTFISKFEKGKIDFLIRIAEMVQLKKGETITKQFGQSHYFYFLINGSVNFSISLEDEIEEFSVGRSDKKYTPIGWSGFRTPNRYATTVRCEKNSVLIKWRHKHLDKLFDQEPILGKEFIQFTAERSVDLLNQVCRKIVEYDNSGIVFEDLERIKGSIGERENIIVPGSLELLQKALFFEVFPERTLRAMSRILVKKWYLKGDKIFSQGEESTGIDILAYGKVAIYYNKNDKVNNLDNSGVLAVVDRPGRIIGWRCLSADMVNETTAIATRDTVIYQLSKKNLDKILQKDPELAYIFTKRLLWLISVRLRNARAGLISRSYEKEIISINNLIDQNSTQLSVSSPLHKLPHLLSNTYTLDDAFNLLFDLEKNGNSLEKDLSILSLDILGKVHRQHTFFEGLKHVYQSVTEAPESLTHKEIRAQADKLYVGVFEKLPYVIKGWENLPDKPGHIFIYNHLLNHPSNTLPNDFQITLDSHFISSMILYRKYGEPSIRVVRVPKAEEYGHENYYDRLGHINVYTNDSELRSETENEKKQKNKKFFDTAAAYLKEGTNLMISPEGNSLTTEDSPGPFKPGAFLLAGNVDPEPYIVPIATANFDKTVNQNVFVVVIKKPFLISEQLGKGLNDKNELKKFLDYYRNEFRTYVEQAADIANNSENSEFNLKNFEKVDKSEVVIDKNLFESDIKLLERRYVGKTEEPTIFYGSSTIRLWRNLKKHFPDYNILNFGFGGARIDYCTYYFDRIIRPNNLKSLIFYAGDNDIGDGRLPKQIFNSFVKFYNKFREFFPHKRFTYVSIKPSPERFIFKERILAANDLIRQYLLDDPNSFYLNIYDEMLDKKGYVNQKLFTEDNLHLSLNGYKLWNDIFKKNESEIFV